MTSPSPPTALTIAGSDSGGGAGVAADLKTFEAHGVWGLAAITAVTAQNTLGVASFARVDPGLVRGQIEAVATDIGVGAAKTGMLADEEIVLVVAQALAEFQIETLVVDPVFISKHGDPLLTVDAVDALRRHVIPRAALVTPNLPEAAGLAGTGPVRTRREMEAAGRAILDLGAAAVLVKGGHLEPDGGGESGSPDCLVTPDAIEWFEGERIPGRHTHGTGCVVSAAVTARLARGADLRDAVSGAKAFVAEAISAGLALGHGVGPVNPGAVLGPGIA